MNKINLKNYIKFMNTVTFAFNKYQRKIKLRRNPTRKIEGGES